MKDGNKKQNKETSTSANQIKKSGTNYKDLTEGFKLIIENTADIIFQVTLTGKITYMSPSCERIADYKPEEMIGKSFTKFVPKKELPRYFSKIKEMISGKKINSFETYVVHKDRHLIPVEFSGQIVKIKNKSFINGVLRDITKRKKAEMELFRTKEFLQNVIDSATEFILTFDVNGKISFWNKSAERITGFKAQQIIGRQPTMLEVFDNPKELEDYLNKVSEGEMPTFDDLLLKTKSGRKKLIKTTNSIIKSKGEQPTGILFIGKDISRESETHGKLLPGASYLIINENIEPALGLFTDLTISNHDGLLITRDSLSKIQSIFPSIDVDVVELTQENIQGVDCVYDPDTLTAKIEEFSSKHFRPIVLFDRIDYLLSNFSFEKVIKALYKINDIIALNNAILLLRLNPTIIDKRQLAIIEEEIKKLPSQRMENIKLEDELYDILTYVYKQDKRNILVSFQKVSREFSISKATTARRVGSLKEKDLIFIKKRGKAKTMHVSEKGKVLLHKRKAV